jgi:outer membrane protein TolC
MFGFIKKILAVFSLMTCSLILNAQSNAISLDSCYALAKKNYPLVKRYEFIAKSKEYSLENIAKGFLPRINLNGQASYQSDVTQLPKVIPGVPVLTKDQYKFYADLNQPIYDGGVIKAQKKMQEANSIAEVQQLEVDLYQLRDRIDQLYFGILLINEQLIQNSLFMNDVQLGLNKTNAQIANGAALRSNAAVLKAELLKAVQQSVELNSNRRALMDMLELFINRPIEDSTVFLRTPGTIAPKQITRPELLLFNYQDNILNAQNNLLNTRKNPRLSFFAQGGFGKPAFNILNNNVEPFYIGGLRLSFPLSDFYTLKNERSLININRQNIQVQKELFLFNTNLSLKQQSSDITKLQQFLKIDDEIIPLRESVKKAALAQLENGVINSSDYLREANAESSARQNKILHEIQMLMVQYKEANTTGS